MNELMNFTHSEFGALNVLLIDGKPHFPATDCARMLGYANPHDALKQHCRYLAKREVPHPQNPDKLMEKNYMPIGDFSRLITHSHLPEAERYERWVFDDVITSVHEHGGYLSPAKLEAALLNPDTVIQLATTLKAEREKRIVLETEVAQKEQIISELQPKAGYYDLILQNKSLVAVSNIAKDYGMSARAFNALLHDMGVQYRMGDCWLLYQKYAEQGYTQSRTHIVDAEKSVMHTYWTQKGRLFLYALLKHQRGLLPLIERTGAQVELNMQEVDHNG